MLPLSDLERTAIERALRKTGGDIGWAAEMLGLGRATLYRRLQGARMLSVLDSARQRGPTWGPRDRTPTVPEIERAAIAKALLRAGTVQGAARLLGVNRNTVYRRAEELELRLANVCRARVRKAPRGQGGSARKQEAFIAAAYVIGLDRAQELLDELRARGLE